MTQYAFGSGTLIGKRTDVANTPPALLGTLQDVSLDFDRKIELLLGQYNMPVAAGGGEFKIAGKAKFARLQATQINNLFLGQTLTANSMLEMTTGETDTVASGAVTVANGSTFVEDYGVFYAATGAQLAPVASSPAQGQYSVASGVYSFNSADNGAAVLIYYSYTVASGQQDQPRQPAHRPAADVRDLAEGDVQLFRHRQGSGGQAQRLRLAEAVAAVLQPEIHRRRVRFPGASPTRRTISAPSA